MTIRDMRSLESSLERWNNFEDCLLHDVHPVMFGYGLELVLNYVWSEDGTVRPDAVEKPRLVVLRLLGLESLEFRGGLSPAMKQEPEAINWGLTEVASVRAKEAPSEMAIAVEWESERKITAQFVEMEIIEV